MSAAGKAHAEAQGAETMQPPHAERAEECATRRSGVVAQSGRGRGPREGSASPATRPGIAYR